jgi:hypothetical protein
MTWTALDDFDKIGYVDHKNDNQNVVMNIDFNYHVSFLRWKLLERPLISRLT